MTQKNTMKKANAMAAVLAAGVVSLTFISSASAIQCKGRYQVVSGNLISTSYCEDNYVAVVARKYGYRVSKAAIRNNPNKKREICRQIGHDSRLSGICDTKIFKRFR